MESLTHNGLSLAFEDAGTGAPPIILLHDLGMDHTSLHLLFTHFRSKHRVVSVDLPGHGRSDSLSRAYAPEDFADDLDWLFSALGIYHGVAVGWGIGGIIAVELGTQATDLLAAAVAVDTPILHLKMTKRHRIQRIEQSRYLVATSKRTETWDGAAALALCKVPLLMIESQRLCAGAGQIHKTNPRVVVEYAQFRRFRRQELAKRINAFIDDFLLANENL